MAKMTTYTTTELQEFIEDNRDKLNKQTLTTYRNDYKRFRTQMKDRKNIYNLSQKEIIDVVKNTDFNKKALLNIAIVFLKWKNKEITRLLKYRTDLEEMREEKQAEKNKAQLEKSGATYEDLMKALEISNGMDYILFYLLIKLNTRNNDLIAKMISKKEKDKLNIEDNFMVVSPSKVIYIRNDYKTHSTNGTKKDVIRDEKFVKIMNSEVGNREYAFVNNKHKPYKQTEIGKFIKARFKSYKQLDLPPDTNISQSTIYKIIQHHQEKNGNIKAMKTMADNRGQNIETQLKFYSQTDFNDKKAEESDDEE